MTSEKQPHHINITGHLRFPWDHSLRRGVFALSDVLFVVLAGRSMATPSDNGWLRRRSSPRSRVQHSCERVIDVEACRALTEALSLEPSPLTPPRLSRWVDALTALGAEPT